MDDGHHVERPPIEVLWEAVRAQSGRARGWHHDDLHNHQWRYQADLRLVAALAPRGAILELGAAPCHMTALLKLAGYESVGIDIDPDRVGDLIRRFELDVRRCDIERAPLPFGDERFACVLLCDTFEHLRIDPAFVLSEINRVTKPGGALLLTTPNVHSLPNLARFLRGHSIADPLTEFGKLRGFGHMGHVREYSAPEVARFLHAFGLVPQSIAYRSHPLRKGWRGRLLGVLYRLAPRRFRREIVIVARKSAPSPRLAPLIPQCD